MRRPIHTIAAVAKDIWADLGAPIAPAPPVIWLNRFPPRVRRAAQLANGVAWTVLSVVLSISAVHHVADEMHGPANAGKNQHSQGCQSGPVGVMPAGVLLPHKESRSRGRRDSEVFEYAGNAAPFGSVNAGAGKDRDPGDGDELAGALNLLPHSNAPHAVAPTAGNAGRESIT